MAQVRRPRRATGSTHRPRPRRPRARRSSAAQIPVYELVREEGWPSSRPRPISCWPRSASRSTTTSRLRLFADAGATVAGQRVRFDAGHVRALCSTAPSTFTQLARDPAHSVEIGGDAVVFAPAYGSPFVRDLAGGRRYGSLADFENFVKLAWAVPWLHHSGGTVCEPVDVPVNKRHLDMVYATCATAPSRSWVRSPVPSRAEDSVEMARIAFGADVARVELRDPRQRQRQLAAGVGRGHDRARSAPTPRPTRRPSWCRSSSAGRWARSPWPATSPRPTPRRWSASPSASSPGRAHPPIYGNFLSSMALRSGSPTFGTPEPAIGSLVVGQMARRVGLPLRCSGAFTSVQGARRPGDAGVGGVDAGGDPVRGQLHPPLGRVAGGRPGDGLREVPRRRRLLRRRCTATSPASTCPRSSSPSTASARSGRASTSSAPQHTLRHYETAFWDSWVADNSSFEQWRDAGERRIEERAADKVAELLANYERTADRRRRRRGAGRLRRPPQGRPDMLLRSLRRIGGATR